MTQKGTLLLSQKEVAGLIGLNECIAAVEGALRLYGEGEIPKPGILGMRTTNGGFHIKTAMLDRGGRYFAAKINANFPENSQKHGLPAIQGVIVLSNAENGYPLAIMDSIEITLLRTGAATAIAAKHLSRPDSKTVTLCGCGNQGRIQLRSLREVRPVRKVFAYDIDEERAKAFADQCSKDLDIKPVSRKQLPSAVIASDICVTCTPSRQYFIAREDVRPGTFIAAVGADSEEKQEIDPSLFVSSTIVVDSLEQCSSIGDLHHAILQGIVKKDGVHAELGEIVAGRKPGRTSSGEIIIFDSTGMAIQDVAAAVHVYKRAEENNVGARVTFA